MSIYPTKSYPIVTGLSEFEILKASHKFLREDVSEDHHNDDKGNGNEVGASTSAGNKRWEDKLAEKYYENLYREFAVCDLKHYKSGNFALRWRTETEVLSGAGESTCGNTRCKYHFDDSTASSNGLGRKREKRRAEPRFTTLELPFAYVEHGEAKNALVKVVLCTRCVKKLMWKRRKDKEEREMRELGINPGTVDGMDDVSEESEEDMGDEDEKTDGKRKGKEKGKEKEREKEKLGRTRIREDDKDLQRRPAAAVDGEERSNKKRGIRGERDSHDEGRTRPTRDSRSRRRNSRSRSPGRRHANSQPQSSSARRS